MSFFISSEQIGDAAALQCAGRVVGPERPSRLKDAVTCLSQPRIVVLDLAAVEMVDARGLGMMVFLHNWACANGIQVKLVNPFQTGAKDAVNDGSDVCIARLIGRRRNRDVL